ncbi:MAG: DUF309 domain-containing protein [Pirellulaceae bacterium]
MNPPAYDPRFLAGVKYFNECEFFEAHDAWEELWADYQGPSRFFYKGLIHAAVCLHHFGNENARGAIKLYHSCHKYLGEYRPHYEGVDIDKLLSELDACCADLVGSDEEFPRVQIVPDLIPEIHLDPPPDQR